MSNFYQMTGPEDPTTIRQSASENRPGTGTANSTAVPTFKYVSPYSEDKEVETFICKPNTTYDIQLRRGKPSGLDGRKFLVSEAHHMVESEFFVGQDVEFSIDGTVRPDGTGPMSPYEKIKDGVTDETFCVDGAGVVLVQNLRRFVAQ